MHKSIQWVFCLLIVHLGICDYYQHHARIIFL